MIATTRTSHTTRTYFDAEAALDRCCGDVDFLAEMVDLLQTTVVSQLQEIDQAIASQCPVELGAAAHAMKGTVASMTSSRPYELALRLERLGKSSSCEHADLIAEELRISVDQLLREAEQWIAVNRVAGTTPD